jgi:hypothetical protein
MKCFFSWVAGVASNWIYVLKASQVEFGDLGLRVKMVREIFCII